MCDVSTFSVLPTSDPNVQLPLTRPSQPVCVDSIVQGKLRRSTGWALVRFLRIMSLNDDRIEERSREGKESRRGLSNPRPYMHNFYMLNIDSAPGISGMSNRFLLIFSSDVWPSGPEAEQAAPRLNHYADLYMNAQLPAWYMLSNSVPRYSLVLSR